MIGQSAMTISDDLRHAIRNSGKSVTAIAKESGVPQPMLTRFMNGQDLRLATVDKLAAQLGLTLQPDDQTATAKAKVKATAMPATDWGTAQPKRKAKGIPTPEQAEARARGKRK